MEVILIVMLGLFREDNVAFFDTACQDNPETSWQYVGVQKTDPTRLNLPTKDPVTGEEIVIFSCE